MKSSKKCTFLSVLNFGLIFVIIRSLTLRCLNGISQFKDRVGGWYFSFSFKIK